jgi:hypothetical protein
MNELVGSSHMPLVILTALLDQVEPSELPAAFSATVCAFRSVRMGLNRQSQSFR